MSKSTYANAEWDPQRSTYMQLIVFKNSKIKSIPGFSAKIDHNESKDKKAILERWILRNYNCGYLNHKKETKSYAEGGMDEVLKIDIYFKPKGRKNHDTLFFSLYQTFHEWNPDYYRPELDNFLNDFYRLKAEGKNPSKILTSKMGSKKYSDLNPSIERFYNRASLRSFCTATYNEGVYAFGEIKAYYIKYCDKFLGDYNNSDEDFWNQLNANKHII